MVDEPDGPGSLRGLSAFAEVGPARLYLRPLGLGDDSFGPDSRLLAGGPLRFDRAEVILRREDRSERAVATLPEIGSWCRSHDLAPAFEERLAAVCAPRTLPGREPQSRDPAPLVMGIINVTPDSFSDGGDFYDAGLAIEHGLGLIDQGAEILDVGGESTRPGAEPVSPEEQIRRVIPVVEALTAAGATVSIDTRHAAVMRAALDVGATIINDVTALTGDPDSLAVVVESRAPVVLMHMKGEPHSMQAAPGYADAPLDVYDYLAQRVEACVAAGISRDRITVDPGIGFGKTVDHNAEILRHTALFHGLGCPILIGVSRKSFIGVLSRGEPAKERLGGSLAAGLVALSQGAQMLRMHDIAQTRQAVKVWRAVTANRLENDAIDT